MPQLDKVTFFYTAFWLLFLYVLQYLFLSVSQIYIFVSSFKLKLKRAIFTIFYIRNAIEIFSVILYFPWVFDVQKHKSI